MTGRSKKAAVEHIAELEARIEELEAQIAIARTKDDEMIPEAVVAALIAGENPVKVWRKCRGLTLAQLSDATERAGRRVDLAYMSEIERGVKPGSFAAMGAIARALNIDLDDLVPAADFLVHDQRNAAMTVSSPKPISGRMAGRATIRAGLGSKVVKAGKFGPKGPMTRKVKKGPALRRLAARPATKDDETGTSGARKRK